MTITCFASELTIDYDSEQLYMVTANEVELDQLISGFYVNDDVFISLLPFLNGIHADYKQDNQRIVGWLFSHENRFSVAMEETDNTFIYDNDVYFNLSQFCKDKSITLKYNIAYGELLLSSQGLFGHQIKKVLNGHQKNKGDKYRPQQVALPHNYKLFTTPVVNTRINVTTNRHVTTVDANLSSSGDVLMGTLRSNASIHDNTFKINHLNYSKLFNNNIISSVQAGDMFYSSKHVLLPGTSGRGIEIRKQKEGYTRFFSNEVIQGYYKPNYTVELLYNKHVIETTETDDTGYYQFDNIQLAMGNNDYRLRFYGKYGDVFVKDHSFNISNDLIERGQVYYNLSIINQNKGLIEKSADDQAKFNANVGYGISSTLTYDVGIQHSNSVTDLSSSLSYSTKDTVNHIELGNINNQWLGTFNTIGVMLNTRYEFNIGKLQSSDNISLSLRHSIDSSIPLFNHVSWFATGRLRRSRGDKTHELRFGFYKHLGNLSIKYQLDNKDDVTSTRVSLLAPFNGYYVNYAISKDPSNINHELSIRKNVFNTQFSFGLGKESHNDLALQLSTRTQFKRFKLTSNIRYLDGNYAAGISINSDIWFDKKPRYTTQSLQFTGSIKATAFIDENYNNIQDGNEKGLANVKFRGGSLWSDVRTNQYGVATLPGVSHLSPKRLKIDAQEVDDFTLLPPEPITLTTHSGGVTEVQLPFKRIKIVEFILKDEQGALLQHTRFTMTSSKQVIKGYTDDQGYYVNEEVFPGEFTLKTNELEATISIDMDDDQDEYYFDNVVVKNTKTVQGNEL